jgi:hypothetical protein
VRNKATNESTQTMMDVSEINFPENNPLDKLRLKAEAETHVGKSARRPTWAPPLVLSDELADLCRTLGWLTPEEPAVARLWARFFDPRRHNGCAVCTGFELHAGTERKGDRFFETMRYDGPTRTWNGRTWTHGEWRSGPRWCPPTEAHSEKYQQRYPLYVRAVELAAKRVAEFAGDPDTQMRIAGTLCSQCCICGKAITDPISLERGIGPECWRFNSGEERKAITKKQATVKPPPPPPEIIKVVRDISDLTFAPTPHTISQFDATGKRNERTEFSNDAVLYDGPPKPATIVKSNAYGEAFAKRINLTKVYVGPYAQHKLAIHIHFIEPGKRKHHYFQPDEFPLFSQLMLAWEYWDVNLDGLPVGKDPILWHDGDGLVAHWREAQRRFTELAGEYLWLDTVEASLAALRDRHPERGV